MTQPVVTRFDVETVKLITNIAKKTGRTRSAWIREAVEEQLADAELLRLAQSRSKDLKAGRSYTISWEEVQKRNGLQVGNIA